MNCIGSNLEVYELRPARVFCAAPPRLIETFMHLIYYDWGGRTCRTEEQKR